MDGSDDAAIRVRAVELAERWTPPPPCRRVFALAVRRSGRAPEVFAAELLYTGLLIAQGLHAQACADPYGPSDALYRVEGLTGCYDKRLHSLTGAELVRWAESEARDYADASAREWAGIERRGGSVPFDEQGAVGKQWKAMREQDEPSDAAHAHLWDVDRLPLLTDRERQVWEATQDGYKPVEIAQGLDITPQRVRQLLKRATEKLAARKVA